MKAIFLAICISTVALSATASEFAGDSYVIDQRDPKYQAAIEHLSSASQALRLAQDELKKAEASHPLPGLDLVRMLSQVRPVEETINVVLSPEVKRLRYQELTPDGQFFTTPPRLGD
ncbi:hypothetical protein H8F21_14595 [Pseudomonas sp. P66]|uniref:Conjugal transfer protein n=1 Tax=Pseudomonas arcuscaelestis TaxID=2710591 RepID=A0ABS2C166_9PSED|nr:hypothetical protein [Pseudomonas arcuscaelestis]MBM5458794.1 hypothetical protein [Pseudomonas arcuscaelestis]